MNRLLKLCALMVFMLTGLTLGGCNGASNRALDMIGQDGPKLGFNFRTLTRGDHVRKYGVFVPISYKATNKYPVIIFLQGVGEGCGWGQGDGKNLTVGLGPFVALQKATFPFIVIFPQSAGGWSADSEYAQDVITALDDVSKEYSVDADRVSLTGLSTGGYGTYVIGAKYRDRFAALVPMGSNDSESAVSGQLVNLSVRAYCSAGGDMFAGNNDQRMVERINSLGGHAAFIQTDTFGHDCWEAVYGSGELFGWLQNQRRRTAIAPAAIPSTPRGAAPVSTPTPMAAVPAPVLAPAAAVRTNGAAAVNTSY